MQHCNTAHVSLTKEREELRTKTSAVASLMLPSPTRVPIRVNIATLKYNNSTLYLQLAGVCCSPQLQFSSRRPIPRRNFWTKNRGLRLSQDGCAFQESSLRQNLYHPNSSKLFVGGRCSQTKPVFDPALNSEIFYPCWCRHPKCLPRLGRIWSCVVSQEVFSDSSSYLAVSKWQSGYVVFTTPFCLHSLLTWVLLQMNLDITLQSNVLIMRLKSCNSSRNYHFSGSRLVHTFQTPEWTLTLHCDCAFLLRIYILHGCSIATTPRPGCFFGKIYRKMPTSRRLPTN